MSEAIAVVGMACRYPGADNPQQLWENVLARRRSFRRIPVERINLDDYLAVKNDSGDSFYITEAAVIEGYEFDRVRYRVAGRTFRSVDLTHWLALDVAAQALVDAGFTNAQGLPRKTTGVLIGNSLTGEFSRAALLRLRWPYVRRIFDAQLRKIGWTKEQRQDFFVHVESDFKSPFEPVNEETLAGGLSNTIAGRICNYFDLAGGGYTLDGACSSSLLAIANACNALISGDLDAVIAGGIDLSLDPFELIGFSKATALTDGEMRVYDEHAHGFLPGEGCGLVVLMRHKDALQRGLRCYATIRGWGIASDGSGGITRPEIEGQRLAIQRAYQRADYDISSVAFFEGHGTGTKVGDEVELSALIAELSNKDRIQPSVISSIKANIGHTKAAAGIAGFINAALAVHRQLIPPATGVIKPHPILGSNTNVLEVLKKGKRWPQNQPRRAGISSFGFGGINVHTTIEGSYSDKQKTTLSIKEKKLLVSYQDAELFFLGGQDRESLKNSIQHLLIIAARLSQAELIDVAAQLSEQCYEQENYRAAITASTPTELSQRLGMLLDWLIQGIEQRIDLINSVFLGSGKNKPRISFLFPGQASPVRLNGGLMGRRFVDVENLYQQIDLVNSPIDTFSTAIAQPAIVAAQLAGLQLLQRFGIVADNVLGHSLGELSSLYWSGAVDEITLIRLAKIRGQVMQNAPMGAMASIGLDRQSMSALLESEQDLFMAGFNASNQTVIAGETTAVKRFVAEIQSKGIMATILPVEHAFHTPLMQPVIEELINHLSKEQFKPINRIFFSTVRGALVQEDINIKDLLTKQLTAPVQFLDAVSSLLAATDLAIEVGPGAVLTGLLSEQKKVPVISLDVSGSSLVGLLQTLGLVYAQGGTVNCKTLFADRFYRPFKLDWKPIFFANPCESAPLPDQSLPVKKVSVETIETKVLPSNLDSCQTTLGLVMQLISSRTELPLEALQPQKRLLTDLHLNSISVSELVVAASRHLKLAPPAAILDYSNVTIAELAEGLQAIQNSGGHTENQLEQYPSGVDNWVRVFTINKKSCPLRSKESKFKGGGLWQCFSSDPLTNLNSLSLKLKDWGGAGVLLYLPAEFKESDISLLLEATKTSLQQQEIQRYFVLLQAQNGIASSVIKTLHLESQNLTTLVIGIPKRHPLIDEWIIAELQVAKGYTEVFYDENGDRWKPTLALLPLVSENNGLPLNSGDVLLVTGGGKGIAAECALMLAQETGTKLAIIGRSDPKNDEELAANLKRFSAQGINYRYLQADVCVEDEVRSAVISLEPDFGTVTALLHGAGINHPQPLSALDEITFLSTLAPKVHGLNHLLGVIQPHKLKIVINFGSIIARSGMSGEADYALANIWQTRLLEQFNERYPDCHCLSIEWSVWSGVGMGERLGRIDALLREGISPITPAQGVDILRQLVSAKLPYNSVIVSGRLGEMPTLTLEQHELPFLRFLERCRVYYPGVELIVEADLSTDSDPYLKDHVYDSEQILPGVIGLEAMAQVAMALADRVIPPIFEQVEFLQPIVVNEKEKVILRIAALMRNDNVVEVVIRCDKTNYLINHFRALCLFEKDKHDNFIAFQVNSTSTAASINPKTELYGHLFFHSGRFVRVSHYNFFNAWQCCAEIETDQASNWFSRYLPQDLVLGDPGSRDAAVHALQVCIPHMTVIPIAIEQLQVFDNNCHGPWILHARERFHEGDVFVYDLQLINKDGKLREIWRGLKLKKIAEKQHKQWLDSLLPPYLERQLESINSGDKINIALLRDAELDRKERGKKSIQNIFGTTKTIHYSSNGKPEVEGYYVSVAHNNNLTLSVSSKVIVSCDIERIIERETGFWSTVLGEKGINMAKQLMQQSGTESYDFSVTRLWTVFECLKKAELPLDTPLLLQSFSTDGWVVLEAGKYKIGSVIVNFRQKDGQFALAVLFSQSRNG